MPSFTTPKTWAAGETVQADGSSGLNAQLRDNMLVTGWHVIQQVVTTAAVAAIDFTGIPQGGYEHLRAQVMGRGTQAAANVTLSAQFASDSSTAPTWDTATNYSHQNMQANGTSLAALMTHGATSMFLGSLAAANAPAGMCGWADVQVFSYPRGELHKGVASNSAAIIATSTAGIVSNKLDSAWRSTSPIKGMRLFLSAGNFSSGSIATLYMLRSTSTST